MRAKPHVVLLHYTAHPVTGGVESVLDQHRRLLTAAGYPVTVLAGRGDATILPELDSRHPDVERLYLELGRGDVDDELYRALRDDLAERLRAVPKDVVVAHNVMTMPFNLPLTDALPDVGAPVVAWTHDVAWLNPRYAGYQRDGRPYDLLHVPSSSTTYVAISELRRVELASAYGVQAAVVPNGVDIAALVRVRPPTIDLLRRAGVWEANPLVLVPVRITRRKRLEDALELASQVRERFPSSGWVVTGPLGPHQADNREYWEELRNLRHQLRLEKTFAFLHEFGEGGIHPVDDQMMGELYGLAAAVFLPSESEGFGLPVVEAALTKTPLVGTDIPAFVEVGGQHGYPVGDVDAAAEALQAALGASRQIAARQTYTWEAIFPKIARVIADAVA